MSELYKVINPFTRKLTRRDFIRFAISFTCYLVATFLSIYFIDAGIPVHIGNVSFEFTFKDIPLIMITGLHGYFWGMLLLFTVFIYKALSDTRYLYMMFVFSTTVLAVGHMAKYRWFTKRTRSMEGAVITAFLLGPLWWFLATRIGDIAILRPELENYFIYYLGTLPECVISFFCLHQIFYYMHDNIKLLLPIGVFYTDRDYVVIQKSLLSIRLTVIIAIDCILLSISAAFISDFLIPSLPYDVIQKSKNGGTVSGLSDILLTNPNIPWSVSEEDMSSESDHVTFDLTKILSPINYGVFVFNRHGVAYNIRLFMLIMNAAIPLGILTNFYTQRRIASPLIRLASAARAFSNVSRHDHAYYEKLSKEERHRINLEISSDVRAKVQDIHSLQIDTGNEVEDLYHSVEAAADFMVGYVDQLREDQKLEEDLRIAQQANTAKNSFLSNMSHELRTPINVILGMDEMILREYENDENLCLYAGSIQISGRTLLSLVNDILDFSKIEAGKMEIIPVEYDISSLITDLYNMIAIKTQDKRLELKINVDPNIPHILYGDDIRIKQCILNILTNAVKYTQEGTITMNISYEDVDSYNIRLKISVKDTGIGMKEEEMDRLFTPFERMDEVRNRTIEGTGLGMSIVKMLLDMMDSKLEVKSEYGKGSEFSFAVQQRIINREPLGDFASSFKNAIQTHSKYHCSFHAPGDSILVVDDTIMNLTVITGLLKNTQLTIDTATSGHQCLQMVREKSYDILFIDHRMPEMDGIETLLQLKRMGSENRSMNAPCIALTANAIAGAREEYLEAGFTDYLSKPIDTDKLDKMLIDYLPSGSVHLYGTPEYIADTKASSKNNNTAADTRTAVENDVSSKDLISFGTDIGLDIMQAIKNCGTAETLRNVLKDFWLGIDEKGRLIEQYAAEKDWNNYTIQVHSLKSSARLIGAMKLSKDAEYLEQCGEEENEAEISSKTQPLLTLFYSYRERLKDLFEDANSGKENLPFITEVELKEYTDGIRELVEAFDFDSADEAIKDLDQNYRIPKEYIARMDHVRKLLSAVDRDGLLHIL